GAPQYGRDRGGVEDLRPRSPSAPGARTVRSPGQAFLARLRREPLGSNRPGASRIGRRPARSGRVPDRPPDPDLEKGTGIFFEKGRPLPRPALQMPHRPKKTPVLFSARVLSLVRRIP